MPEDENNKVEQIPGPKQEDRGEQNTKDHEENGLKSKETSTEEKEIQKVEDTKNKGDEKKEDKVKKPGEKKPKEEEEKGGEEKTVKGKPKEEVKTKVETKPEPTLGLSPLIFGKYNLMEVEVEDPGLKRYINITPIGIPHTGAKHANKWFGKMRINIVERLINNMMRSEHSTGKKFFAYKTVKNAFDLIYKRTKQNPVQVLISALQNSSPKEEITRLRFGGISVPKAVDTSSSHRLDVALRNICKGAVNASHKNKKRMAVCLAEEIILASKADMNSFAISKKEEMERIAASAR